MVLLGLRGLRFLNQKKIKLEHAVPRPCVLNPVSISITRSEISGRSFLFD